MVMYIGTAKTRIISERDWAKMGIDQGDVVWSADNDWTVDANSLNDDAVAFLVSQSDEWVVDAATPVDAAQLEFDFEPELEFDE